MTPRRYRQRASGIHLVDHSESIHGLQFGNPLPTFRASCVAVADGAGSGPHREYFSDAESMDTVFWNYWDENYDRRFFEPFIQPSGDDQDRIGAVLLLVPGLYAIRATIDWEDFFTATVRMGSNYDDGGNETRYREDNWWYSPDTLNHFRHLWENFDGSENEVEIVVGHDDPSMASHTIPGEHNGAWGMCPHLTIAYLGGLQGEPNYLEDVDVTGPPE